MQVAWGHDVLLLFKVDIQNEVAKTLGERIGRIEHIVLRGSSRSLDAQGKHAGFIALSWVVASFGAVFPLVLESARHGVLAQAVGPGDLRENEKV
jgi:hypothetical protein